MKKMIISILLLACCCIANKPTHYFEGKWYNCIEYKIVKPKYYNQTVCNEYGTCFDYDSKGNLIHCKTSDGVEWWSDYDSKGNLIHSKNSYGKEWWYKWFFNKKENTKYQCDVDRNGNPEF